VYRRGTYRATSRHTHARGVRNVVPGIASFSMQLAARRPLVRNCVHMCETAITGVRELDGPRQTALAPALARRRSGRCWGCCGMLRDAWITVTVDSPVPIGFHGESVSLCRAAPRGCPPEVVPASREGVFVDAVDPG